MTATTITLQRLFRFGSVDLPDPNASLSPAEVLNHYASSTFPALLGGSVGAGTVENDQIVFTLEKPKYKSNG